MNRQKTKILPIANLEDPRMEAIANEAILKFLKECLPSLSEKTKVLDAGCGGGLLSQLLKQKFKMEIIGVDFADEALKLARKRGVQARKADLEKRLPFKNNTFDLIIFCQVIEHLFNPDQALQEIYRVLKKGGSLIVTTPNLAAWFNRGLLLLGSQPFFMETSTLDKTVGLSWSRRLTVNRQPIGHLRIFTLGALKGILGLHHFNFQLAAAYSTPYFPWYARLVDRIFCLSPSWGSELVLWVKK